jgi:hypothetical protein
VVWIPDKRQERIDSAGRVAESKTFLCCYLVSTKTKRVLRFELVGKDWEAA